MTTYVVDRRGHTLTADGPLLLCYDGSDHAAYAIERAGALFAGQPALVVTVWQRPSHGSSPVVERPREHGDVHRGASRRGGPPRQRGRPDRRRAGLSAEPAPVEATGPVWTTILEIADRHDAATIVMGSEVLAMRQALGSVSGEVVHHAARPALVIPPRLPAAT